MPESKRVRLSADDFSEEERVIFSRTDDVLVKVARLKDAKRYRRPHRLSLFLYQFRRRPQFFRVRHRKRKRQFLRAGFCFFLKDAGFFGQSPSRALENLLRRFYRGGLRLRRKAQ